MAKKSSYLQTFIKAAQDETQEFISKNNYTLIKKAIDEWLKTQERLNKKLTKTYEEIKHIEKLTGVNKKGEEIITQAGIRRTIEKQTEAKFRIKGIYNENDIVNLLKDGYRLIEYIREFFTGQEIVYSILFDNGNGEIAEAKINLEQLLNAVSNEITVQRKKYNSESLLYSAKLSITNANIKNFIKEQENSQKLYNLLSSADNQLWDSLVAARDKEGLDKYAYNKGNIYEAYSVIKNVERFSKITYIGQRQHNLAITLIKQKNSIAFYKAGDLGLTQLKAVLGSAADLADMNTLVDIIKKLQNIFNSNLSQEDFTKQITNLFTPLESQIEYKIETEARKEAVSKIEEIIPKIL